MFHVREEVHPSIGYLRLYQTDQGLNIPQLLNDDFFEAIKLLFNARMYVSSMKLLLSFLDTIAFLDCGASGGPAFQSWLGTYVDLAPTGATAQELWEFRNSLLHMTNLDSKKVSSGKMRRLMCYVGDLPAGAPGETADAKFVSFGRLFPAVVAGVGRFLSDLDADRAKLLLFIERYDLIVSDQRMLWFQSGDGNSAQRP